MNWLDNGSHFALALGIVILAAVTIASLLYRHDAQVKARRRRDLARQTRRAIVEAAFDEVGYRRDLRLHETRRTSTRQEG